MKMQRPGWDEYFMAFALVASSRSHDPDTRHGAIIVNRQRHIIGSGYNGYPAGGQDHAYPDTRPDKYDWMIHAEANAIVNCPSEKQGATLYVTGCPCPNCMGLVINSGIKRVVIGSVQSAMVDAEAQRVVGIMARDCGVQLHALGSDVGRVVSMAILTKGSK